MWIAISSYVATTVGLMTDDSCMTQMVLARKSKSEQTMIMRHLTYHSKTANVTIHKYETALY
jgi:hypothetical protein